MNTFPESRNPTFNPEGNQIPVPENQDQFIDLIKSYISSIQKSDQEGKLSHFRNLSKILTINNIIEFFNIKDDEIYDPKNTESAENIGSASDLINYLRHTLTNILPFSYQEANNPIFRYLLLIEQSSQSLSSESSEVEKNDLITKVDVIYSKLLKLISQSKIKIKDIPILVDAIFQFEKHRVSSDSQKMYDKLTLTYRVVELISKLFELTEITIYEPIVFNQLFEIVFDIIPESFQNLDPEDYEGIIETLAYIYQEFVKIIDKISKKDFNKIDYKINYEKTFNALNEAFKQNSFYTLRFGAMIVKMLVKIKQKKPEQFTNMGNQISKLAKSLTNSNLNPLLNSLQTIANKKSELTLDDLKSVINNIINNFSYLKDIFLILEELRSLNDATDIRSLKSISNLISKILKKFELKAQARQNKKIRGDIRPVFPFCNNPRELLHQNTNDQTKKIPPVFRAKLDDYLLFELFHQHTNDQTENISTEFRENLDNNRLLELLNQYINDQTENISTEFREKLVNYCNELVNPKKLIDPFSIYFLYIHLKKIKLPCIPRYYNFDEFKNILNNEFQIHIDLELNSIQIDAVLRMFIENNYLIDASGNIDMFTLTIFYLKLKDFYKTKGYEFDEEIFFNILKLYGIERSEVTEGDEIKFDHSALRLYSIFASNSTQEKNKDFTELLEICIDLKNNDARSFRSSIASKVSNLTLENKINLIMLIAEIKPRFRFFAKYVTQHLSIRNDLYYRITLESRIESLEYELAKWFEEKLKNKNLQLDDDTLKALDYIRETLTINVLNFLKQLKESIDKALQSSYNEEVDNTQMKLKNQEGIQYTPTEQSGLKSSDDPTNPKQRTQALERREPYVTPKSNKNNEGEGNVEVGRNVEAGVTSSEKIIDQLEAILFLKTFLEKYRTDLLVREKQNGSIFTGVKGLVRKISGNSIPYRVKHEKKILREMYVRYGDDHIKRILKIIDDLLGDDNFKQTEQGQWIIKAISLLANMNNLKGYGLSDVESHSLAFPSMLSSFNLENIQRLLNEGSNTNIDTQKTESGQDIPTQILNLIETSLNFVAPDDLRSSAISFLQSLSNTISEQEDTEKNTTGQPLQEAIEEKAIDELRNESTLQALVVALSDKNFVPKLIHYIKKLEQIVKPEQETPEQKKPDPVEHPLIKATERLLNEEREKGESADSFKFNLYDALYYEFFSIIPNLNDYNINAANQNEQDTGNSNSTAIVPYDPRANAIVPWSDQTSINSNLPNEPTNGGVNQNELLIINKIIEMVTSPNVETGASIEDILSEADKIYANFKTLENIIKNQENEEHLKKLNTFILIGFIRHIIHKSNVNIENQGESEADDLDLKNAAAMFIASQGPVMIDYDLLKLITEDQYEAVKDMPADITTLFVIKYYRWDYYQFYDRLAGDPSLSENRLIIYKLLLKNALRMVLQETAEDQVEEVTTIRIKRFFDYIENFPIDTFKGDDDLSNLINELKNKYIEYLSSDDKNSHHIGKVLEKTDLEEGDLQKLLRYLLGDNASLPDTNTITSSNYENENPLEPPFQNLLQKIEENPNIDSDVKNNLTNQLNRLRGLQEGLDAKVLDSIAVNISQTLENLKKVSSEENSPFQIIQQLIANCIDESLYNEKNKLIAFAIFHRIPDILSTHFDTFWKPALESLINFAVFTEMWSTSSINTKVLENFFNSFSENASNDYLNSLINHLINKVLKDKSTDNDSNNEAIYYICQFLLKNFSKVSQQNYESLKEVLVKLASSSRAIFNSVLKPLITENIFSLLNSGATESSEIVNSSLAFNIELVNRLFLVANNDYEYGKNLFIEIFLDGIFNHLEKLDNPKSISSQIKTIFNKLVDLPEQYRVGFITSLKKRVYWCKEYNNGVYKFIEPYFLRLVIDWFNTNSIGQVFPEGSDVLEL
ncbi:MAG: hypothetical protein KatS3mg085_129 [Candidatus Dojkabacteria bacterium]|nr:MAG: hypothetical protein KatS3mg085_129 [Candidatus Dojkabacteria bacterium]